MKFRILLFQFLFIFVFCLETRASSLGQPFPRELEQDLSAGATALYNLDFVSANRHLQQAIQLQPDHPAAYFFLTMLTWYRLSYDSLLNRNPALEKLLEKRADETIDRAKKFSKNPQTQAVGYLYWGGALGAKGWYYFSRNQWVKAYFSGKKGYAYMQKVVEIDPEIYDAYLGIGMYEYYAATLGSVLKALASLVVRGNKESAMRSLRIAEVMSRYVRTEASYFLWNAAVGEGRLGDALEKIDVMNRVYPNSPLFRWCEIEVLFCQRKWEEVLRKGEEYGALAHAAPQPEHYVNPYMSLMGKVLYHCGAAAFNLKNFSLAKSYFDKTIDQPAEFNGWKVMAYLRRGELFDLEGKRMDAVGKYRTVLSFPEVWNSYKVAKDHIKKPFLMEKMAEEGILYSPLELWNQNIK